MNTPAAEKAFIRTNARSSSCGRQRQRKSRIHEFSCSCSNVFFPLKAQLFLSPLSHLGAPFCLHALFRLLFPSCLHTAEVTSFTLPMTHWWDTVPAIQRCNGTPHQPSRLSQPAGGNGHCCYVFHPTHWYSPANCKLLGTDVWALPFHNGAKLELLVGRTWPCVFGKECKALLLPWASGCSPADLCPSHRGSGLQLSLRTPLSPSARMEGHGHQKDGLHCWQRQDTHVVQQHLLHLLLAISAKPCFKGQKATSMVDCSLIVYLWLFSWSRNWLTSFFIHI